MKPLIVANWKANPPTFSEAKKLFTKVKSGLEKKQKADVIICPPFVYLANLSAIAGEKIKLGAQDTFWQEGAFTGEISAKMLKDIGCKYVIIGHSERRAFGETDEMVNKKIKACFLQNLIPIFCIGESIQERQAGKTAQILRSQIREALKGISRIKIEKLVIVYEPIWAISTTSNRRNCDFEDALSMQILIRKIISELYNRQVSKRIRVIFGGNVRPDNVLGYIQESRMGGALVGGASLDAKEFIAILRKF